MTFDEWWNSWSVKDWNDIVSAKNLFQQAFEAGLHADVHTDNSKVIADLEEKLANADYQLEGRDLKIKELETQIEKMKKQYDYAFSQLCESREIVCSMLSQYRNKKEIDYSTRERGEKLLKQGVYTYE